MPVNYPFAAVLGCDPDTADGLDDMALALVLTTLSPAIGGVLVRGEKGTAKSTAVRGLADVLPPIEVLVGDRYSSDPASGEADGSPDGPFAADADRESRPVRLVELPVGATEDRVLGSLHLESALAAGRAEFEPGLLARAHRGVLYVDEVNLLHDHLVDVLLDAAAMGRVTVERDGVSVAHPARFVLVGTMNPEEGELRPQLLDRFGLTVEVAAPREAKARAEVIRRRIDFDADPRAFTTRYDAASARLRDRIAAAQTLLGEVVLDDTVLVRIAEVCAAFGVDGLRADIVTARTAAAHAAWCGRVEVTDTDIRVAARLALPHRRRRNPFDSPGFDDDLLDDVLGPEEPDTPDDDPEPPGGGDGGEGGSGGDGDASYESGPPGHDRDDATQSPPDDASPDAPDPRVASYESRSPGHDRDDATPAAPPSDATTVAAGHAFRTRRFAVQGIGEGAAGRRSRAVTTTGRRVGAARPAPGGPTGGIHLSETVRAAVPHQVRRGRAPGSGTPLRLALDDLRTAVREGRESNLVLFCVDASGSMAARRRMEQVKTAVLSLLMDAYQRRDKVAVISFRGEQAEVLLPPTGSVEVAARRLDELPAGGRTPLSEGLEAASDLLRTEALRDPRRRPLLVLVTDGRATAGRDPVHRSRLAADRLAHAGVAALVVDCEAGPMRLGLARVLAERLGAEYVPVAEVSAELLVDAARQRAA
ncbi:magnesium chelatase subunit D family protein [Nocardioides sp. BGMRC 2183]|nr:magnesium chelatase subunit D family protein [Nocardioides sp. BGMRC 2183]